MNRTLGLCFGAYLQDSHNPGLFMLGTYLLHQVDALHRLEFLSIDEEHRTPGLGVKVMFQREHPSIQGHSTPGIKQTSGAATKELRQEYLGWRGIEWDSSLQWAEESESQELGTRTHPLLL